AYPPDPCRGSFVSRTGLVGGLTLEHAPPADLPVSEFRGRITFGDQVYDAVGTIAQTADRDGGYAFQVIGQNVQAGAAAPRVHIAGRYVPATVTPCVKPGDIAPCFRPGDVNPCFRPGDVTPCVKPGGTLTGDYILLGAGGKSVDEG